MINRKVAVIDIEKIPTIDHSSKGNQPKWQKGNSWYKADYMGYEGLSEYVISKLLVRSNIHNFINYEICQIVRNNEITNGCKSMNFRKEEETIIPLERLHRDYKGIGLAKALAKIEDTKGRIKYTVEFVEEVTGLTKIGQYITAVITTDALFLNEDRHTNNIAVIKNEKTGTFRTCPIYDNGLSLLSNNHRYKIGEDIYKLIDTVEAKPFDRSFFNQLDAASQLYGNEVEFYFSRHDVEEILGGLNKYYSNEILDRIERVLLEQMRKYKAYIKN